MIMSKLVVSTRECSIVSLHEGLRTRYICKVIFCAVLLSKIEVNVAVAIPVVNDVS